MDINKKSRSELKPYYVKNAVPTESNFRDLIDAPLNQKDDGIAKAGGDALNLEAASAGDKKVINFYESFSETKPAWVLSLLSGPSGGANSKRGFGLRDGSGNMRLFIDSGTGNIGLGTPAPQKPVDVTGDALFRGAAYLGNSDLYFTNTDHPHSMIGNAPGCAAIENAADPFNTLMILGRSTPQGRSVTIFDNCTVSSALTVGASLNVGGASTLSGGLTANGAGNFTGMVNIGPGENQGRSLLLNIRGTKAVPIPVIPDDPHDRPGLAITGDYPELTLFSGVDNPTYGATIRLGSYEPGGKTYKHWAIGTGGLGANRLEIGWGGDPNPHAGINDYQGKTLFRITRMGDGFGVTEVFGELSARHVYETSDAALKQDVTEMHGVLDQVLQLKPVRFAWKSNQQQSIGFVAQDVEPLFPELVGSSEQIERPEGQGARTIKTLSYGSFGALAIAGLKELKQTSDERLTELQLRHDQLTSRHAAEVQTLTERIAALEARLR
jgi:hypothetical protein